MTEPLETKQPFSQRYGPWAVVAGASEGLGAEFATQLAARGLNLVLAARRASLLENLSARLEREHGVEVGCLAIDLSSTGAAAEIERFSAGLDVGLLVYNAASSIVGPFLESPLEDHLREIDTNVGAPLRLSYAFGPRLAKRGKGGLILMSSLSAFQGSAYIANYGATKSYLLVLAEALAEEWRELGVDVLVCAAGAIRTPNFLASQPQKTGGLADATIEASLVARESLEGLGKQSLVIPGLTNRLASFVMRHLLPRRVAVGMMANILRAKYASHPDHPPA